MTLTIRRAGLTAVCATTAVLLAACGGGSAGVTRTVTATATQTVTATVQSSPSEVETSPSGGSAVETGVPYTDTVKTWPVKWCQAQPGISKQALIDLMGPPTSDFGPEPGNPQSSWSFAEYQFNAFYDLDGNVRQLDINDISLTDAEKASITCDSTRTA